MRSIIRQVCAAALLLTASACGVPSAIPSNFFTGDGVAAVVGRLPFKSDGKEYKYTTGSVNLISIDQVTESRVPNAVALFQSGDTHSLTSMLNDSEIEKRTRVAKPNDHGRFEFSRIAPGRYYLLGIVPFCELAKGSDCSVLTKRDVVLQEILKTRSEDLFVDLR